MAIGGTLAYLSTVTDPVTNSFTFLGGDAIDAEVAETFNPEDAKNLTPGKEVNKLVTLKNTSNPGEDLEMEEWAALRITFKDGEGNQLKQSDYEKLMGLITIDWNKTDWTPASAWQEGVGSKPQEIYDYNTKLSCKEPNNVTKQLFTKVVIKSDISNDDMTWLKDTLKGFKIDVEGAAIQADGYATINDAKGELNALFPSAASV